MSTYGKVEHVLASLDRHMFVIVTAVNGPDDYETYGVFFGHADGTSLHAAVKNVGFVNGETHIVTAGGIVVLPEGKSQKEPALLEEGVRRPLLGCPLEYFSISEQEGTPKVKPMHPDVLWENFIDPAM